MPNPTHCPECGNPIPPDSPDGHCPNCLLQQALSAGKPEGVGDDSLPDVGSLPASESDITATSGGEGTGPEPPAPAPPGKTIVISAADTSPASVGTKVRYLGDYEILEEIARGGMGVVYKARQVSLNRTVAVKMILAGHLAGEAEVKRFHTEAEVAANLQHPNIVAIHEVGQHQGQHYFSMNYVNGPNLAKWAKTQAVSPPAAARLVMTLARAVHFAHQRGTLHRDLKPHNILIDESGQPRITDFGLAKRTSQSSQLTLEGAVMGSPSYMPPEQALGRQDLVGPASDVYALGAILYELLTGRPPFGPGPFAAVLRQVVEGEPAPPSRLNAMVPVNLETICLKCLEKRSERRYASARDLAEELERFLNQEPILARPASPARKAWAWLARNPWLLMGAGAVLLLTLSGLAYGLWEQNRHLVWEHARTSTPSPPPTAAVNLPLILFLVVGGFVGAPFCFADFADRKRRGFTLGPRQLLIYGGIGMGFIVSAIVFTLAYVHDWIWKLALPERSNHPTWFFFATLVCAWFGGLLLFHVAREARIRSLGLRPANEDDLFPPIPRQGRRFTVADRQGLNLVLAAALVTVWLFRLLFSDTPTLSMRLFSALMAAEVPIGLAVYRLARKSTARHALLCIMVICMIFAFSFLRPMAEWDTETRQRQIATAIGLVVGVVLAVRLTQLEKERDQGTLSALEEAEFAWCGQRPKQFGSLVLCSMVLVVAITALLEGFPVHDALVVIVLLMAILPHEVACWLRAKGRERRGRLHTAWLIAISVLSAAFGLPLGRAGCGVIAGLLIGLPALAFMQHQSKRFSKA